MKVVNPRSILVFFLLIAAFSLSFGNSTSQKYLFSDEDRTHCIDILQEEMINGKGWSKIKAAEYLISLNYTSQIKETFEKELTSIEGDTLYMTGIWKVLAKISYQNNEQIVWIDKIRSLLPGKNVNYSKYAAEVLSDLGYRFSADEKTFLINEIQGSVGEKDQVSSAQAQQCMMLANEGTEKDIPLLLTLLNDPDHRVRIEAANALLRIERRIPHRLNWIAWSIIIFYFLSMIGIGYIYMLTNKSADDYHLGGRTMKSFTVGLSLFATLLSTISYLSVPGEIIKHGPLFLAFILAMPVVYFVIGGLFIPFIMRLRVTSAYEILERRFNGSVRTLSSTIFLLLRLLWMSIIIYATTDKVLIPIMGLSQDMTPWLGTIIGIITILYTSMGGIKAVVLTDAIQTFILFGGAVLVLILITIKLGGVGEWWPAHWMEHWAPLRWGFQTTGERSFGWFFLSPLIWWVCTTGSDQISIQRFLSTRDVKTARKVLLTSLIANTIVLCFLSLLGFALLMFFSYNPHLMQEGQNIYNNADQLLPQYIITSLPQWASGIVIAGLMAAAMSSLSAGVNSSGAVIMEDFLNRFRKVKFTGKTNLRLAKIVSIVVGFIVVVFSLYASIVPGNLLEVTARVANLLTAPLFIMFFLAMFVPWATPFGAWTGTIASSILAIVISFWQNIFGTPGPGFLYILPASLVVGIVVGVIISWLPIGQGPKPMISKYDQ